MKKICVFLIGTNLSGKTTTAKMLIHKLGGGIQRTDKTITWCNGNLAMAGRYAVDKPHGGVDSLNCTKTLADVVEEALKHKDVVVCEGSYMNTFGINLTNAIFKAERQLVVSLYCDVYEVIRRQRTRPKAKGDIKAIMSKAKMSLSSASKWASIGVDTMYFNTKEISTEDIVNQIINEINKIQ